MCLQYMSFFENTVGKGEIAGNEQFLLFSQCFLPVWRPFCHFQQNWNCCLQPLSIWTSVEFFVWDRVNLLSRNHNFYHFYTPTKQMFYGVYWNYPVCPSLLVSFSVSVCVLNTSFCQSPREGIKSPLVTALISFILSLNVSKSLMS